MNSTAITGDGEIRTIRDLIDGMARLKPGAPFLISPETGRTLTFRELREQSVLISVQLQQAGLERGDKVAFLLDNGLFTAQLFLGAMYGGFVTVPLNVRAGASSLSFTMDHCDAKVVFVGDPYAGLIKEIMATVRRPVKIIMANVDDVVTAVDAAASEVSLPIPAPEDMALLMYTSGSTGQPKAAMHSHRTVLAHGSNSISAHELSDADRSLLVLPLYHINAECVTLVPTLLSGGTVIVPHGFSVSHFWDWLDDHRCTWSAVVPTIISQLLDWKDPNKDRRQAAFQRIRFLRSSSAPLSPSLHREFLDKFKLLLIQAMGSTEGGNIFSNPLPPGANKIGSPGLPWGFETRIVTQDGADAPAGETGEVFIRGPALMYGYYKDPEGTATVLSPDGWFRTGDLAYRDQDGYFFVVGRSKELIIKGGVNIAPKQIDEALESHPAVLEAAAVGVPDRYVGEDVIAFVVLRSGNVVEERELLSFCEGRLGHFKTPTRIRFVKDLPKGPSGKVQRLKLQEKAVPPPDSAPGGSKLDLTATGDGQASRIGPVAPSTPIEQTIAATWTELLSQPQIDLHANFFSLGGHSLLAIQCLSRLREKLPVVLSLSDFFENATVALQAALIRKRLRPDDSSSMEAIVAWEEELLRKTGAPAADDTIPHRDSSLPCPLSPNQKRIWFMELLNAGVPVYNESEAVRLRGELNVGALEKALNAIIARHEILRTTIETVAEEPSAVVRESWQLRLKQIDLSAIAPARREAEVERMLVDEPRLPYDLKSEPGIRATLLRLGPEEHVFILMMHHLICDWSSEGVFWRELSALYRAGCRNQPLELPALPVQHGDYAAWEEKRLNQNILAEDLAYWEENLRGAPALLELPADRPRPVINSYKGARQRFRIPSALGQALRECSRREKISLFTLFTAVLDTLLYRYTGQEDIMVGIPLADRDRPELQSVIGFLLHTHVLRTQVAGEMSFRELLARVQKGVLDLYAHRSPPFEQVVSRVKTGRNLSYSPLFQVMINWRDRDQQLSFIGMEGLAVESLLAETKTSKFDLTLMFTDDLDDIWLEMEYNTDLFDRDRIERMVGHYQTLLEAVVTDSDKRLSDLPMLTRAERQQLLVEWNRTEAAYPRDRCLHELIEEQVARTPESVAIVSEETRLTFRQLDDRANQLAGKLQELGVGPDKLVGICMERSLEMVIGLLGILKTGGAYVPLDPAYPKDRLKFMLDDAKPVALLTQRNLRETLPPHGTTLVYLDANDQTAFTTTRRVAPGSKSRPDSLAYVLFTSGSTGRPKGVAVEHRSAVAFATWARRVFTDEEFSGVLFSTSIGFDLSVFELFVTLANGGKVILAKNALELPSLRAASEVRMINTVPSALVELVRGGLPQSVTTVNSGGEHLVQSLADEICAQPSVRRVYDLYGPTETTVYSMVTLRERGGKATIGRPISNTSLYILDDRLQPVPIGIPGQLCIAGAGLARGYFNRPELTAEKFVPDPFQSQPGARFYKTGDLARYTSDGTIEYLGRMDHQVKLRGFRIELGEIESVLVALPKVKEAVVMAREDAPGGKRLVAYLTSNNGELPKDLEFRDLLKAKLPDYMVPAAFVRLDRFPLTPNGKVDRKRLPAPDPGMRETGKAFFPPQNPTEQALGHIWCEILGLNRVSTRDDFFDLGGHSLLVVRLQARVAKELGRRLPLAAFFQASTLAQQAALLSELAGGPAESRVMTFRVGRAGTPLFLFDQPTISRLLAGHMPPSRPVHYIDSRVENELAVWEKTGRVELSLQELASRYAQDVRSVQAEGPYCLAGFCTGGTIAFAVAQCLASQGQQVGFVGLVDAFYRPTIEVGFTARLRRLGFYAYKTATAGYGYVSRKLRRQWRHLPHRLERLKTRVLGTENSGPSEEEKAYWRRVVFIREIVKAYRTEPCKGEVILFRAIWNPYPAVISSNKWGWHEVVRDGLRLVDFEGSHLDLWEEPILTDLINRIEGYLLGVDAELAGKPAGELHQSGNALPDGIRLPRSERIGALRESERGSHRFGPPAASAS